MDVIFVVLMDNPRCDGFVVLIVDCRCHHFMEQKEK